MRKNPTRVAGVVLSAASAITGGLANPAVTAYSQVLIRGSAISLGAANAVKAYRDAPKGKKWKAALTAAGSFAVGFVAGRAGAEAVDLANIVDSIDLGNSAKAGVPHHGPITDEKVDTINLEDIGKSPTQVQDNQPEGGNVSHHNHHHNHLDSNTQGPRGEGETDAPPPEVTESKITTHILEPRDTYQLPGGSEVTADSDHEITVQEGFTDGEDKYTKVSILENETGERTVMLVGEKGVISQEKYDDQGNIYESTEIINGQEQKTEYQYNENCELSEKLIYDSEGHLDRRVEITYNENGDTVYRHLDGNDNPIKTVIKDSDGIMTEQTNGNNIDNAEQIKEGEQDNSQKGGENAGENNKAVPEGITAEQTNGNNDVVLDDNNRDSADSVVSNDTANLNDATPQGGENASVGNNNAVPEGITAEQTNGDTKGNAEKQSDGKLSEEELAEILKQRMREQGAVDAAYKEHFQDARDVEKLFYTQKIFNMDNQLHGMESAGQQDTQEYQKLEDKLNGELKKIDMVRDEETGEIMSKEKYAALQEHRQAEAQPAEKADTTKDNNNAEQEDITAKHTTGNEEKTEDKFLDEGTKGGENEQPTGQEIIQDAAIQFHNNTVIEEAKNNLHLYQDENGKKYWAQSPGGEPVAYGEKGMERFMLTFQKEETYLTAMDKSGQTGSDIYQKVHEAHQEKEQLLGIEKDEKGIYRHVGENKANSHTNGEHTKTPETQPQSKINGFIQKLGLRRNSK